MNTFCDFHHNSLRNSLVMLFEDRLKGQIYFPIGKEWFTDGWWKIANIYNNAPETIQQYLGTDNIKQDQFGIYQVWDAEYENYKKGLTLEKFWEIPIDIVIASVPEHIQSFSRLASLKGAKFVYQAGNNWSIQEGYARNIMASALIKDVPPETNIVTYHQEQDTCIFYPSPPTSKRIIYSFINCFMTAEHYKKDWNEFLELEALLPDWEFRSFGGSCRDSSITPAKKLGAKFREANFIHHVKKFGDGFGHNFFAAFMSGRPMITRASDYKGKLGEEMLIDMATCIDLDKHSLSETKEILENMSPVQYEFMCQQSRQRFEDMVNYDLEELKIKQWLTKLI